MKIKIKSWQAYLMSIPIVSFITWLITQNAGTVGEFAAATMIIGGIALGGHNIIKNLKTLYVVILSIFMILVIIGLTYVVYQSNYLNYQIPSYLTLAFLINIIYFIIKSIQKKLIKSDNQSPIGLS